VRVVRNATSEDRLESASNDACSCFVEATMLSPFVKKFYDNVWPTREERNLKNRWSEFILVGPGMGPITINVFCIGSRARTSPYAYYFVYIRMMLCLDLSNVSKRHIEHLL
jgi:hypothetical protein